MFGTLTLKTKLTLMTSAASVVALLLACGSLFTYYAFAARAEIERSLSIQAAITGYNAVSALRFSDRISARDTLEALRADPNITAAALYDADDELFVSFSAPNGPLQLPQRAMRNDGTVRFGDDAASIDHALVSDGERVGTLRIDYGLGGLATDGRRYLWITASVLLVALTVSLLIALPVQRHLSEALTSLSQTATAVSRDKDYSIRVSTRNRGDEVGTLIAAFNEMLDQIERRDVAVAEATERLDLALRSSGVGTWEWDMRSGRVAWDRYMHALFGLAPDTFGGRIEDFTQLVHPEDRTRVAEELEGVVDKGTSYENVFRVMDPDGTIRYVSGRGSVYRDPSGRALRLAGVCWDASESRRAEQEVLRLNVELEERVSRRTAELEAINKELEAFTYSVSHDLRAPLRRIDGFARLLLDDYGSSLEGDAARYLGRVREGTRSMGQLVDDMLNLARVSRQEIRRQVTGLSSVVDKVRADMAVESEGRAIEWRVGVLPFVDCDPKLIEVVFTNLLSNAVKYTRPRALAVIEIGTIQHGDQAPVIFVRDNGVGFSMKYAEKLFGVFQRLHRAEDFEGTGVGLATVQRILHKHGGAIWAESELDKGTTFYFSMEARPQAQPAADEGVYATQQA